MLRVISQGQGLLSLLDNARVILRLSRSVVYVNGSSVNDPAVTEKTNVQSRYLSSTSEPSNLLLLSHSSTPWRVQGNLIYSSSAQPEQHEYIQRDFSAETFDCNDIFKEACTHEAELKAEVEALKPDMVLVKDLLETHYIMRLNSMFRKLGYKGRFEDLRGGRGKGVFIRDDLVHVGTHSVFRSKQPNPQ